MEFEELLNDSTKDELRKYSSIVNSKLIAYISRNPNSTLGEGQFTKDSDLDVHLRKCMASKVYSIIDVRCFTMMIRKPTFTQRILPLLDNRFMTNTPFRIGNPSILRIVDQIKLMYRDQEGWNNQKISSDGFYEDESNAVWSLTQLFKLYSSRNTQEKETGYSIIT